MNELVDSAYKSGLIPSAGGGGRVSYTSITTVSETVSGCVGLASRTPLDRQTPSSTGEIKNEVFDNASPIAVRQYIICVFTYLHVVGTCTEHPGTMLIE